MAVSRISEIHESDEPFDFINLMEVPANQLDQFVADWQRRAKIMGQEKGFISADLEKSLLKDAKYSIINVAHWQSYDAFLAANSDPKYAQKLTADLNETNQVQVTRGYYRPVASYTHLYN